MTSREEALRNSPAISVVLPTRNPDASRLHRVLGSLEWQTLPVETWELVIVDNGSDPPIEPELGWHSRARAVFEASTGLTPARMRGLAETSAPVLVFVDDDNVLDSDYLARVRRLFDSDPQLGAAGGAVVPEFEAAPPDWTREFWPLLALQDYGEESQLARGGSSQDWPSFAPVGAGLCVRREAAALYAAAIESDPSRCRLDRAGRSLASGGDSDLVFTLLHGGWNVGYFPELRVTHLIPSTRLTIDYLCQLNESIQRSWVRVLALHEKCPWPEIARWTVPLRALRAYLRARAWQSPADRIRWRGYLGRFLGQADLGRTR